MLMPQSAIGNCSENDVSPINFAAENLAAPRESRPLHILLVDDDLNDSTFFQIAVRRSALGISLQSVMDGGLAIDYLEGRCPYVDRSQYPLPDLVVLDLSMQLTGGLEFLEWRRSSASFSSLPVVIFSGFAYKGAIDAALAMGASSFIAKPFLFEEWMPVIHQIWEIGTECLHAHHAGT
jgi:CheY-like chemotaxis protein